MDAPASLEFALDARVVKVNSSLGLIFGWGLVCKENGSAYEDLQGDTIPEESMLDASLDFAKSARDARAMHAGGPVGTVVFLWPMTTEIAKAFGIETATTGLMVAMLPDEETRKGFEDGTYTGFSIGGKRVVDEVVLEKYSDDQERDDHGRFGSGGGGGSTTGSHTSTQGSSETTQVREKAIGVVREGDTYHFVDGSGATVASAQGHAGLQAMLSATGLKGIDQEVRDLRPGQSYHYKRDFGAGVFDETGEPAELIEKYDDSQARDERGMWSAGGGSSGPGAEHRAAETAHRAESDRWTKVVDSHMEAVNQIYNERNADKKPGSEGRNQAREQQANAHWDQANQAASKANAASDKAVQAHRMDLAERGIDYRIADLQSVGAKIPESIMRESRASLRSGEMQARIRDFARGPSHERSAGNVRGFLR